MSCQEIHASWRSENGGPIKCMLDVGKNIHRLMERRMSRMGMTGVQSRILGYIYFKEKKGIDIFQKDIEEAFRMQKSSVTSVIQLLEKKKLISRESVPYDARLKKLVMTQEGRSVQQETIEELHRMEKQVKEALTPEETEKLFLYMEKIDQRISAMYEEAEES